MAEIYAVDAQHPDTEVIRKAARILRSGGLVAFPTETVYGLGADATNPEAIRRIYEAKGRPPTNPLIIHCESVEQIRRDCVTDWPDDAQKLAEAFWPGPLTLILPKSPQIPDLATAGLKFVGVRIPEPPVARALIAAAGRPIAAPSANRSNRISPTLAQHVADDLGGRIEMILDAGPCRAGVESTVLDLSGASPRILRPGPITARQIALVLGQPVQSTEEFISHEVAHSAPGQSRVHYAPTKRLELWLGRFPELSPSDMAETALLVLGKTAGQVVDPGAKFKITKVISRSAEAENQLYATLHEWDREPMVRQIMVVVLNLSPEWSAVMNRLTRAAAVVHE